MLNTALLAFSFGMLGAGGYAAQSALDLQRSTYRPAQPEAIDTSEHGADRRQLHLGSMR